MQFRQCPAGQSSEITWRCVIKWLNIMDLLSNLSFHLKLGALGVVVVCSAYFIIVMQDTIYAKTTKLLQNIMIICLIAVGPPLTH